MEKSHDTPDDAWTCFSFRLTSHVSSHYCFFVVKSSTLTRLGSLDHILYYYMNLIAFDSMWSYHMVWAITAAKSMPARVA